MSVLCNLNALFAEYREKNNMNRDNNSHNNCRHRARAFKIPIINKLNDGDGCKLNFRRDEEDNGTNCDHASFKKEEDIVPETDPAKGKDNLKEGLWEVCTEGG